MRRHANKPHNPRQDYLPFSPMGYLGGIFAARNVLESLGLTKLRVNQPLRQLTAPEPF